MALKNSSEYSSIVVVDIAKSAPSVSTGPKAKKIAISPSPLLATSLTGLAV